MCMLCLCSAIVSRWLCFCLVPPWSQSGLIWCWFFTKSLTFNRRIWGPDQAPGQLLGVRGCFSFSVFTALNCSTSEIHLLDQNLHLLPPLPLACPLPSCGDLSSAHPWCPRLSAPLLVTPFLDQTDTMQWWAVGMCADGPEPLSSLLLVAPLPVPSSGGPIIDCSPCRFLSTSAEGHINQKHVFSALSITKPFGNPFIHNLFTPCCTPHQSHFPNNFLFRPPTSPEPSPSGRWSQFPLYQEARNHPFVLPRLPCFPYFNFFFS